MSLVLDYQSPRQTKRSLWQRYLFAPGFLILFFGAVYAAFFGDAELPAFLLGVIEEAIGLALIVIWIVQQVRGRSRR
jgi:hypothetical protein